MNSLENKWAMRGMGLISYMALELGAEFSLADFANQETDEVKELDSLLMPLGTYAVKVTSVALGGGERKEGIDEKTGMPYLPLFFVERKYEIIEAQLVDKKIDADKYVGRTIRDRITFWPNGYDDTVGLLKGDYKRVGLPNTGRLGGLEGAEPGWMDGAVDAIIGLKCTYFKQNGEDRARYKWFRLDVGTAELDAEEEAEKAA